MVSNYNQFAIEGEQKRIEEQRLKHLASLPDGIFYRFKVWYNNPKGVEKARFIEIWTQPRKGENLEFAVNQLPKYLKKGEQFLRCWKVEERLVFNSKMND